MTAYDKNNLYNNYVQQQATAAFKNKLIGANSLSKISEALPFRLYTPNFFVRISLGILSVVAILFSTVLVGAISSASSDSAYVSLAVILALICYGLLELFVASNKYYNAGIDNVLLFAVVLFFIVAFNIIDYPGQYQYTSAFCAVLCCWLAIRFNDSFMAGLSYASIIALCFFTCANAGTTGKLVAPFIIMLVSAMLFLVIKNMLARYTLVLYLRCFKIAELLSLISFYASLNYFVVRELGSLLLDNPIQPNEEIPFGWLFWFCTAVIPPAYVYYGIYRKDLLFVRTGVVLAVASVLTFRNYYAILPASVAMVLFGSLLIIVSYLLIKYLKKPKGGFTSIATSASERLHPDAEALILAQAFGRGNSHHDGGVDFGGGSSGGGGATGSFD